MRGLLLAAVLVPAWALAQPADTPDASVPDASVGAGGADQTSQESEESAKACVYSSECERGFVCLERVCTPTAIRNANFAGCGGSAAPTVVPLLLAVLFGALVQRRRVTGPRS